jgi:Flp pilus assembly protein TadB
MSIHLPVEQIHAKANILPAPLRRNRGERVFDIHPGVHGALFAAYGLFGAILCTAFMGPDLIVPAAIVAVGIVALFVTPALWARVVPADERPLQSWTEFLQEGVECITGHLTARQALAQILVLPALMVSLAFAFAVIKATL